MIVISKVLVSMILGFGACFAIFPVATAATPTFIKLYLARWLTYSGPVDGMGVNPAYLYWYREALNELARFRGIHGAIGDAEFEGWCFGFVIFSVVAFAAIQYFARRVTITQVKEIDGERVH